MASNASRLSLELSESAATMLQEVANHNQMTKADVLRRAIALISYADEVKQKGHRLAVTDGNRNIIADIVAPL